MSDETNDLPEGVAEAAKVLLDAEAYRYRVEHGTLWCVSHNASDGLNAGAESTAEASEGIADWLRSLAARDPGA